MRIFSDIWLFLKALRFVDIIFFFAVLILMILIVSLVYFVLINKEENEELLSEINDVKEETAEMKIVKELKENMASDDVVINFTDYEKDQEDKAIISYEELLSKTNKYDINYSKEEVDGDLTIKTVDLNNLVNEKIEVTSNIDARVISFAKEEAFLQALKQLQKELG